MLNRVMLIGNLGADPEIKHLESGTSVANFSLATSESYKDKSGEWQDKTEWHNIVAWGKAADRTEKLKKGQRIYLEGKLTTESWERDEAKRS